MKVVFLHGIGDGDPGYIWLDGLNRGLEQAGHPPIDRQQVIAPPYSECLRGNDSDGAKIPPVTYRPKDDGIARREFERRQARVQRFLQQQDGVRSCGFNALIPDPVWAVAPGLVVDHVSLMDLGQVKRYVRDDKVRACVLTRVIDYLPSHGDIILIAHSLGSVVAIDLLDHLPPDLRVRRFITVGSPAAIKALHEGGDRLLKKFPYGRVDDWSNFFSGRDIVTGGRGLASTFPGAQDFELGNVRGHGADLYLSDPAVVKLVAQKLYPTTELVRASSGVAVRMSDGEATTLLLQHFARAVGRNIKDAERAERFRAALRILRDDLAAQLDQYVASGHYLAPEMEQLRSGRLADLPHRWGLHEAISELVVLALTNCVAPYEIDPGEAQMRALEDIAVELGFRRRIGTVVAEALREVRGCIAERGGVPWGRVLTAAAGVALLAAGPVGLAVAAPAGVFGAAAIAGGLAAFGPGGGSPGATAPVSLDQLMIQIATAYARMKLDVPFDPNLWYRVTNFEGELSAALNRLTAFSDPKSPRIVQLTASQVAVNALLRLMIEKGLSPKEITDGETKAIEG